MIAASPIRARSTAATRISAAGGPDARQTIAHCHSGGQLRRIRSQNGQAVPDGEAGVATRADQRLLLAGKGRLAAGIEWATQASEESIVHGILEASRRPPGPASTDVDAERIGEQSVVVQYRRLPGGGNVHAGVRQP